jgi:hypothetical protein
MNDRVHTGKCRTEPGSRQVPEKVGTTSPVGSNHLMAPRSEVGQAFTPEKTLSAGKQDFHGTVALRAS